MKRTRTNANYRPKALYLHKDDKALSLKGRTCSIPMGIDTRHVKGTMKRLPATARVRKGTADDSERLRDAAFASTRPPLSAGLYAVMSLGSTK